MNLDSLDWEAAIFNMKHFDNKTLLIRMECEADLVNNAKWLCSWNFKEIRSKESQTEEEGNLKDKHTQKEVIFIEKIKHRIEMRAELVGWLCVLCQ